MKPLQVFEHERLTTSPDALGRKLTVSQYEKLCQFNDQNENKYFTVIRNGIKFSQYVGVIQLGKLTIEILPKVDQSAVNKNNFNAQVATWQKVLMRMLANIGELELEAVSEAGLKKRNNLIDLYFNIYLKELDKLLHQGLVKKYRQTDSNVKALKGRLNFAQHIQHNLIHQERFFTTHQQYDHTHLINQILLKGLNILETIATDSFVSEKVKQLKCLFPEMPEVAITRESFARVRLSRKTASYERALHIARMIILNYSPDITKGDEHMLALLFDMNKLWEKYIYKKLKAAENEHLKVHYQDSARFWENKHIYPDIVLKHRGNVGTVAELPSTEWETTIIDTKWKLISAGNPSDNDLKQMYVYNMYWQSARSILLYPAHGNNTDSPYGKFHRGKDGGNHCKLAFVSVLDGQGALNTNIASEILGKITDK